MVVDIHAHLFAPAAHRELREHPERFPGIEVVSASGETTFVFPGLSRSPPVPEAMTDLEARLRWMDEEGIDLQVFGPWTDLLGYTLPLDQGAEWARFQNEHSSRLCADTPRLIPMATVPLQSPRLAARELEAARELGCRGVMIGSATPERELDSPELEPFWDAAAGLRMPVFVHPIFLTRDPRLDAFGLANAVGRANETALAISRLLFSGALLRYPDLAVIVAHGGAAIPFLLGRLRRNHQLDPVERADPVAGFQRLFFDSVVLEAGAVHRLVEIAGSDRVLMGSDSPFPWEPHPVRTVRSSDLSATAIAGIEGGNAAALFGLE